MHKITVFESVRRNIFEVPAGYSVRHTIEEKGKYRNDFLRDRDRILHSLEFRRLAGKTQAVFPNANDHIRNRLTHTLEVSQISNVIAKYLGLNDSLVEAMALGHDLGHTPFGHVGERTLNFIMNNCESYFEANDIPSGDEKGFKHNLQSVRACCDLERIYPHMNGLNLTNFTLWGIKNHSKASWPCCQYFKKDKCYYKLKSRSCHNKGKLDVNFYDQYNRNTNLDNCDKSAWSFEAYIVNLSDEIAQRHHDMEDAFHAKILGCNDIIDEMASVFEKICDTEDEENFQQLKNNRNYFIPNASKFLINFYTKNLIETSITNLNNIKSKYDLKNRKDFINTYKEISEDDIKNVINFSSEVIEADKLFKDFIFKTIHNSFPVQRMDGKGSYIINQLFKAYINNPKQLRNETIVYTFNLYNDGVRKYPLDYTKKEIGDLRNKISGFSSDNDKKFQTSLLRAICDHMAGMTDDFALAEFTRLYDINNIQSSGY